jgi:hypothetical protein
MNKKKKRKAAAVRGRPSVEARRAQTIARQEYLVGQLKQTFKASRGMPIAKFTISRFPAAGRAAFSRAGYRMEVVNSNGRLSLIDSTTLGVSEGGPVNIQFTVAGGPFRPIGIWFKSVEGGFGPNVDPDSNFPAEYQYHSGQNLNFTDAYLGDGDIYEFGLVIQSTVTHQLAIIDPGIQHINGTPFI